MISLSLLCLLSVHRKNSWGKNKWKKQQQEEDNARVNTGHCIQFWADFSVWIQSHLVMICCWWLLPLYHKRVIIFCIPPATKIIQVPDTASQKSNPWRYVPWKIICITQKFLKLGKRCVTFLKTHWKSILFFQRVQPYCTYHQAQWLRSHHVAKKSCNPNSGEIMILVLLLDPCTAL